jgi:hypothetical protein
LNVASVRQLNLPGANVGGSSTYPMSMETAAYAASRVIIILALSFPVMAVMSLVLASFSLNRLKTLDDWLSGDTKSSGKTGGLSSAKSANSIQIDLQYAPQTWTQSILVEISSEAEKNFDVRKGTTSLPLSRPVSWFTQTLELKIDAPLWVCAATFATLAQKEILVSASACTRKIRISTNPINGKEAFQSFCDAIVAQGIAIVPVAEQTLALLDQQRCGQVE